MKRDTTIIRLGTVAIKVLVLILFALVSVLVGMLIQSANTLSANQVFVPSGYLAEQVIPNGLVVGSSRTFYTTFIAFDEDTRTMNVALLGGQKISLRLLDVTLFQSVPVTLASNLSEAKGISLTDLQPGDRLQITTVENPLSTRELNVEKVVRLEPSN